VRHTLRMFGEHIIPHFQAKARQGGVASAAN